MKPSHEVIKEAINKTGIKAVAPKIGLSKALLYKWCQDPSNSASYKPASGAANPLDRIKKIYELTQNQEIINWICQMADGYFVKNSSDNKASSDARMFKNVQRFIKEFSETLDTISKCYYDDSRIDEKEASLIREEWEELKRIGEGFVRDCEIGRFDKSRKNKDKTK